MFFEERQWDRIVFKPTIDQQGRGVFYGGKERIPALQEKLNAHLSLQDALAQPLIESVRTEGEYSFIFIDGEYSHIAVKKQTSAELQVTRRTGGVTVEEMSPSGSFVREAENIMRAVNEKLLYARIDAVTIKGRLHVMEIELIEPVLYFQFHPSAAERFVEGIAKRL